MAEPLTIDELKELYYKMLLARHFAESLQEQFNKKSIDGTMHLGIGQEASGVGSAMAALKHGDLAILTHRGLNQTIGMGADLAILMGEIHGKSEGCSGGKGGPMHLFDLEHGNYGQTGVVGETFPLACGMAFSQQYQKTGKSVLCTAGEGACSTGNFHEALSLSSVKKLPVVFFIENNLYAMSTPIEKSFSVLNIAERAQAYAIPSMTIDGNDAIEVYKVVSKALKYAREGNGPFLIEALTYRISGNSVNDSEKYRSIQEVESWKKEDPIQRLSDYLLERNMIDGEELYLFDKRALEAVEDARLRALDMTDPQASEVLGHLYAE